MKNKDRILKLLSLLLPLIIFLLINLYEFNKILSLNSSKFVYTLDDPYIHLALGENIIKGHYGINLNEYSSPSSSIIWPFILAPFSFFSFYEYIPLILNLLSSSLTIFFLWKILLLSVESYSLKNLYIIITLLLIVFIPSVNLVGLVFTGMEHSLQVLFAVLILWGIINQIKNNNLSFFFLATVIIAPLIRYENFVLSLAAILYLWFTGYKKESVSILVIILFFTGSFSIFLKTLGLEFFPSSVLAKSRIIRRGLDESTLLFNLKTNLQSPVSLLLGIGLVFLIAAALNYKRNKKERLFAAFISLAVIIHFFIGKFGWYYRYEIYIWSSAIISLLFLYKDLFKMNFYKITFLILITSFFIIKSYIRPLTSTPLGSNNIYEQQYQMHRFITDYYKKPVAVNDIGYTTFRNDNYVLDLWGLGSVKALFNRKVNDGTWMNLICKDYNINFAMIYDRWFPVIPDNWQKIAEMYLGHQQVTAGVDVVTFYCLDKKKKKELLILLDKFSKDLPRGVKFILYN